LVVHLLILLALLLVDNIGILLRQAGHAGQ